MLRLCTVALLALIATPGTAPAQVTLDERVAITPWVGYRIGYNHRMTHIVHDSVGPVTIENSRQYFGDVALGAEIAVRLTRQFSLIGGLAHSSYPGGVNTMTEKGTLPFGDFVSEEDIGSGSLFLGKVGAGFRLPEQTGSGGPRSSLFVALARVAVTANPFPGIEPEDEEPLASYALNLGWKAEFPVPQLGPISLFMAAEDFIIWWNDAEIESRNNAAHERLDNGLRSEVSSRMSHILFGRVGVSFRF